VSQVLYSVDEVAERLGLHVRTIRNYIRQGRLKATRIGKQYRIAAEDLDAFAGRPVAPPARQTARRTRHVEVSAVVEVDAIGPDQANRITGGTVAVAKGRDESDQPLRVQTIYDRERGHLKIIAIGSLPTVEGVLRLVGFLLEQP
jgi:excisionase family DNA binding protein